MPTISISSPGFASAIDDSRISDASTTVKAAEPMTADEVKDSEVQADMDGPLADYAAKGHKVEYLGSESVEGGPAHKLRVTYKNGNSAVMFFHE